MNSSVPNSYCSSIDKANEILKNNLEYVIDETKKSLRDCNLLSTDIFKIEPRETLIPPEKVQEMDGKLTEEKVISNQKSNDIEGSKLTETTLFETIEDKNIMVLNDVKDSHEPTINTVDENSNKG